MWRKAYRDGGRRFRLAALRLFARALGLAPLIPPPPASPEAACRNEQRMIRRLATRGVTVPEVLDAGPRHLVLSDLGETLAAACRREPCPLRRRELIARGLAAIAELHARGVWVSQAFARNMVVAGDRIGFIDFEEDPATVMPRRAAKARDILFFVQSTARFLEDQPQALAALLHDELVRESPAVREEVRRVVRRLWWVPPIARHFGRRSRAVADALMVLAMVLV
ncbi:hypothetical protein P873_07120 [Arenimonas composti TR7-09 = DSM 18010]|uniref:Aminoglycoside phosphotransferase domain-containing protein n=1 Tax=Arenimonas composti TR7-09 = DSM 18010 TaxID=1121013 RepID=A0A091BFD7_9GAMM|nr:hypothetical protein P873_07120 [Arenimonas composti TR7-09 = DSM 18010]